MTPKKFYKKGKNYYAVIGGNLYYWNCYLNKFRISIFNCDEKRLEKDFCIVECSPLEVILLDLEKKGRK